jgi:hypothetical protein
MIYFGLLYSAGKARDRHLPFWVQLHLKGFIGLMVDIQSSQQSSDLDRSGRIPGTAVWVLSMRAM